MKFQVSDNEIRLDNYLAKMMDVSRSQVTKMIKAHEVLVNEKEEKAGYLVKAGDLIYVDHKEEVMEALPEKMDLDIVYEDDDIIVVNKANGVVVHPAPGNYHGTLVNGLLYHSNLSDVNGEFRPGIVHRIDADTTGLLVVAKNNKAHLNLAKQLENKTTYRKYMALVWGVIASDTGTIDAPIGRSPKDRKKMAINPDGKEAITHFKVLKRFKNATLIELKLETGRTHQIRVHMDYIGHPIVNDPVYGKRKLIDDSGQCLHAKELGFTHPTTGEYMKFDSELPDKFLNIMSYFEEV